MQQQSIVIRGCRVNNLKNVSLDIPHNALVVFTGLSGSGKSSLAFDTIYAEGQRRFMESLSSFTKHFLENIDKPDVERIEGLPPTIAIDQRTTSSSPRSTVGTATEMYDALRLLFARAGTPHCPLCGIEVSARTRQHIIHDVGQRIKKGGAAITIAAPLKKGEHIDIDRMLEELEKLSIHALRIDGQSYTLANLIRNPRAMDGVHTIDVIVDRFEHPAEDARDSARIVRSVQRALEFGDGTLSIWEEKIKQGTTITERLTCTRCAYTVEHLEPRHFSFNNPTGACSPCAGLGVLHQFDTELLIPNQKLTVAQGAIHPLSKFYANTHGLMQSINELLVALGTSNSAPLEAYTKKQRDGLLYGLKKESSFGGVIPYLQTKYEQSDSEYIRAELETYMRISTCSSCHGKRLKKDALAVTVAGHSIDQIVAMPIEHLLKLFRSCSLNQSQRAITEPIVNEILNRAQALTRVGLSYLVLDRSMPTLSGGEAQRVKLAAHVSTSLVGVVYCLDEPSVGLHPRDTDHLIATLKELQGLGNTVIVVEHDKQIILAADSIVDIGPGAGKQGGTIVAQGSAQDIVKTKASLTGRYLSGAKAIALPRKKRIRTDACIDLVGVREHNLKNISVRIPTGALVAITGVSGSGKSSLVIDVLSKALMKRFYRSKDIPGAHDDIRGLEYIDKAIVIDQAPIGRTPRSNPITYTNIFTPVRELFTNLPESKIRGFTPGHFSFNVKGGRCETCQGEGMMRIDMRFLSDVYVECGDCGGRRYTPDALEVHFEGLSIADVLDLTVSEACEVFKKISPIYDKLKVLADVGLGYIRLGQPAPTLSGGEAQRIKLAAELSRRSTGRTLTILDEPTTGLHFEDIQQLLGVLDALVAKGNTVLMIEHNLDVIRCADWIIDLGPEGGEAGGYVVAQGSPSDVANNPQSITGRYLKKALIEQGAMKN
ncbi:excinuclease ABC subunit UvrA [Candidatus Uhrbacteria bacterium]|nr:excinuclease ABC subunit UvrA [Candidatus Uhrbacteria bacterium]